ncbi:MAG: cbb3-type cytochrome c oxidase subunit II [bacterium]
MSSQSTSSAHSFVAASATSTSRFGSTSRRIGPDLARTGKRLPSPHWHLRHLIQPTDTSKGSIMPPYPHLSEKPLDFASIRDSVAAMKALGVPYSDQSVSGAEDADRVALIGPPI